MKLTNFDIISVAMSQYGIKENTSNTVHEEKILSYFHEIGHSWVKNDETAWCSAYWNWVIKKCDLTGTGKLNARSWLEAGEKVDIGNAVVGDTVVLWRTAPHSWKGHVGGYINHDNKFIYMIGGNQNNEVNISSYPISRVLEIRRISK